MMVSTGLTVPVAVTVRVTGPRVTGCGRVMDISAGVGEPPGGADRQDHGQRQGSADQPEFS